MSANPPLQTPQVHPSDDALRLVYEQICTSYHDIEDFRGRLLGLLPFVTASSFAVTLISNPQKSQALTDLVLPFGLLGALVTLGLFFYEAENLKRSTLLTAQGRTLEKDMNIIGPFAPHPAGLFNARNAAGLIYSTTFAGWVCLALWFALPGVAIFISLLILIVSTVLSLPFLHRLHIGILQDFEADRSAMVSFP